MKKNELTIADVFRKGLPGYLDAGNKLSLKQWDVVNNILNCHTPELGGHVYECNSCSSTRIHYNSCRDRHCPSCQSLARASWIRKRTEELLPVGYFHVVFTIPSEFNLLVHYNREMLYDLLFKCVSRTLLMLGRDPKWLGATIGFLCVLHTWGQTLIDHPHIHCIVAGGGIREDGKKWRSFRDNYLFPVKVMSRLFQRLFMTEFMKILRGGQCVIPPALSGGEMAKAIRAVRGKQWVVYAKESFTSAGNVINYLGNYTHRIAIANSRLLSMDDSHVNFSYKDHADDGAFKTMQLTVHEFIRRYLLHVLPHGLVRIRYYGFLSNRNRQSNIEKCMKLLKKKYQRTMQISTVKELIFSLFKKDITKCPHCSQGVFVLRSILAPSGHRIRTRKPRYSTHSSSSRRKKYRESTSFNKQSMPLRT